MLALIVPGLVQAQSDVDAFRYSLLNPVGTARYAAVGGAFGALGGDFTTLSTNPAGIGVYRSGEFVFTPSVFGANNKSAFFGETNTDSRTNFNIGNLGLVFTKLYKDDKNVPRTSGWISTSFGLGYNRLANFHNQIHLSGYNTQNSLLDYYVQQANGTSPSNIYNRFPYGAGLAYDAYLIDPDPNDTLRYIPKVINGNVQQSKTITSKGAYDEFVLSFGGNYNNKVYLGATVGIPSIRYEEESNYTEEDINDSFPNFTSFDQFDYLDVSGRGVNLKIGAIYKVTEAVRLGAAIHTPTYLSLKEEYTTEIAPVVTEQPGVIVPALVKPDGLGAYNYRIVTPWRFIGSAAVVLKNFGFLSVDYEYLDYSQASFKMNVVDKQFESGLNKTIESKYTSTSILRVGAEYMYEIFRFRGGVGYMTSPFEGNVPVGDADQSRMTYSLGAGIRDEGYFVDLAYTRSMSKEMHVPYTLNDPNETVGGAVIDKTTGNVLLTVGFRF